MIRRVVVRPPAVEDVAEAVMWDEDSGEHTRLACWFRRPAEMNF
jgi:hypothetical protein